MKSLLPACLVLLLSSFLIVGCGPAQRTTEGDCYYSGKGVLQVLATIGDAAVEWAQSVSERQYQQNQIELARLNGELQEVNMDQLESDYNHAIETKNTYKAIRLKNEINLLDIKADRAELLIDSIERYQERRQQELDSGPRTSLSQIVDKSGDCDSS